MLNVQADKIKQLLNTTELDDRSKQMMEQFFYSIIEQPQFDKIMDLLTRFPDLFDNFCKCFQLKVEFLEKGRTEKEWNLFLQKEDDVLKRLSE